MTAAPGVKSVTGEITDVLFKIGTTGEYAEVKLLAAGQQNAATYRTFDATLIAEFKKRQAGGKGLSATIEYTETSGNYEGRPITYRNLVRIGPPVPPAGAPKADDDFPVPGTLKERPQTAKSPAGGKAAPAPLTPTPPSAPTAAKEAPLARSEPQEPPTPSRAPIDPSTVAVRSYSFSRTYNLGNFESERFELQAQFPPGWSDAEAFAHLRERIQTVRASLPADTSARAAERERREL